MTRSVGTAALGANEARIVIDDSFEVIEILQALRKIETDLQSIYRTTGGAAVFSARAFEDGARFADGSAFADQNSLGL